MHYTGTIWRPPYEAGALLLEVTAGCTHHRCKFCTLYGDLPFSFRMSPLEDVESDLREAQMRCTDPLGALSARLQGLPETVQVRRVFLTGANPFVLKAGRLLEIAGLIRRYLPSVETIGCFGRITDVGLKSGAELTALREAGFDGLTLGIETGDDAALAFMNKGYGAEDILRQCRRLDEAGIRYSFFYLAGISGAGKGTAGARATVELCNQLHPMRIGVNMLTVYPDSELYREIQRGNWQEAGELEKYREMRVLVDGLRIPVEFAALGASNAVPLWGKLPEERESLLGALDGILSGVEEGRLREYRRSLPHL
ncbi:MAG: radical SAM protein [Oscillibacter sp.]|nr:radical SAM protein [Oscillibacter sp.]